MASRKRDAAQIERFLTDLARKDWVRRTERSTWPKFIFHYADIRNVVNVLNEGRLYSRKYLEDNRGLPVSSGSASILAGTDPFVLDCVRFYFRPQTPTQYHAEGVRSQTSLLKSRFPDAHCPVPVFLLFDSASILMRDDCQFSDGSLASPKARIYSSAKDLEDLPWKKIYHSGPFDSSRADESDIILRRNAEIIIPRELEINSLRYIICRSEAEKETLLYLLPDRLRSRYHRIILATSRINLYFRQHTYIDTVRLSSSATYFHFSPETQSIGPFNLRVKLRAPFLDIAPESEDFILEEPFNYKWELPEPADDYKIRMFLDENLVYANSFEETEIPF
jgi:hypothetical protein